MVKIIPHEKAAPERERPMIIDYGVAQISPSVD
jgi:hypothetical protein